MFKCMLCSGSEYTVIKEKLRGGGYSEFHAVQCKTCGLQQLYPLPCIEDDKEFYDKNEHDKTITPDFSIDDLFQKFRFQNESRLRYLKEFGIAKSWKMLDMASGYGFFLKLAGDEGYCFDGIEISRDRRYHCERINPDAVIYTVNLLEEEIPGNLKGNYNLVTMFHLLEHLTDPVLFLRRLGELLNDGGCLVLELPNAANIMMEASEKFNDFFYFRDHVAYYTPQQLVAVLEKSGYDVIKICGNQLYGLTNHYNWIINGTPELKKPSYETCEPMRWLEDMYKKILDLQVKSEYMYAIARKQKKNL